MELQNPCQSCPEIEKKLYQIVSVRAQDKFENFGKSLKRFVRKEMGENSRSSIVIPSENFSLNIWVSFSSSL
tara:strand:+ start:205 stop:420 length:216 start_codon:yes stop_codon:yes gene_type:complete